MANKRQIAKRYAKAFIHVKADREKIAALTGEVKALVTAVQLEDHIRVFFANPTIPREVKLTVVKNLVKHLNLSDYTHSLLEMLIKKNRFSLLPEISVELQNISDKMFDLVRLKVTTAFEPSVSDLDELSSRISDYFGRKTVIERDIDPSIIGGFVIESDGTLIDMSIKGQIKRILSRI